MTASRLERQDALLAAASFGITLLYMNALPPFLMPGDEANYLHEAKRIALGEVLYRDIFELTTPGWPFLVAILFRLFGTTIATAKSATAILHGLTGTLLFVSGRVMGVRRPVAGSLPLLYLAIAVPAWPFASQHWLAVTLSMALLFTCLVMPRLPAVWSVVPGICSGLFVATHQRGAVVGAAVAIWLLLDRLRLDRPDDATWAGWLVAPLAWSCSGPSPWSRHWQGI